MLRGLLLPQLALLACCSAIAAFAQNVSSSSESRSSENPRRVSYGAEVAIGSGHADRGFLINDRAVIQPVTWVSGGFGEFSVWGSLPLTETTDGSRPGIVEMELTREHDLSRLRVAPAVRMFWYHDPVSPFSTRSIEGWLYLSYGVGPLRLFTNQSLDVLTYRGAYFGEAGLESEQRLSESVEIGASVGAGWASATFNDAYIGVAKSALNQISAKSWLTAHLTPRFYFAPNLEFTAITDPAIREGLGRPNYFLVRVATGVEF